jgi:hypothetical protein
MIPPLVRLPPTVLQHDAPESVGSLDALRRSVEAVGSGRTVLVGAHRTTNGALLDEFVVATSLSQRSDAVAIGVATRVGAGRTASVVAREATAAELLGACHVLLLEGEAAACRDAARVVTTLFTEGAHTVSTPTAAIVGARNLPLPDVPGGPPVCWREGGVLLQQVNGAPVERGRVLVVVAGERLPEPEANVLVVVEHPLDAPAVLASALAR